MINIKFYRTLAKNIILGSALLVVFVGVTSFAPKSASAAEPAPTAFDNQCQKTFFGLRPWYYYMKANEFHYFASRNTPEFNAKHFNTAAPCDIKCFNILPQTVANQCNYKGSDIPGVLLAIIDDLLRVAGIVATAFVIVGAFQFVTSQANPEQTARARSTLINAFAGLGVVLVAIAFVDFVLSKLV